jgi:hypothetical protein
MGVGGVGDFDQHGKTEGDEPSIIFGTHAIRINDPCDTSSMGRFIQGTYS